MLQEQDRIFFRNYSIVIGILAVMIVIFLFLARMIGMTDEAYAMPQAKEVSKRTEPVGQVNVEGQAPKQEAASASSSGQEVAQAASGSAEPAAAASESGGSGKPETHEEMGKRVFSGLCFSCHGTGIPGVPQFGNKDMWAPRIAKGKDTLYQHALHGFSGNSGMQMPPKGGNPALSDDEVKAAVDYMVANSQ